MLCITKYFMEVYHESLRKLFQTVCPGRLGMAACLACGTFARRRCSAPIPASSQRACPNPFGPPWVGRSSHLARRGSCAVSWLTCHCRDCRLCCALDGLAQERDVA